MTEFRKVDSVYKKEPIATLKVDVAKELKNRLLLKRHILQYFCYDEDTIDKVNFHISDSNEVCKALKMNANNRVYIPLELNARNDVAYIEYRGWLDGSCSFNKDSGYWSDLNTPLDKREIIRTNKKDLMNELRDYSNFKSNRIPIGKNKVKIFRFLQQNTNISPAIVTSITNLKCKESYLCISRNITDFMFCSTGQAYSSCFSLDSDYGQWTCLPNLMSDSNRVLMFITTGKIKSYIIDSKKFHHLRMLRRCWAHYSMKDKCFFLTSSSYGQHQIDPDSFHNTIDSVVRNGLFTKDVLTISRWDTGRFTNGLRVHCYDDGVDRHKWMINKDKSSTLVAASRHLNTMPAFNRKLVREYTYEQHTGYSPEHGFTPKATLHKFIRDGITNTDDFQSVQCYNCGNTLEEVDDQHNTEDGYTYCEECYYEAYFDCECGACGVHRDNGTVVYSDRNYTSRVCENCRDDSYFYCEDCNHYKTVDDMVTIEDTNNCVCVRCVEGGDYHACSNQCGTFSSDGINLTDEEDWLCHSCYEDYMEDKAEEIVVLIEDANDLSSKTTVEEASTVEAVIDEAVEQMARMSTVMPEYSPNMPITQLMGIEHLTAEWRDSSDNTTEVIPNVQS